MDPFALKVFASLGIPGLAVGLIYFLIKHWKLQIPMPPPSWGGPIVILIIAVIGYLTFSVIDRIFPTSQRKLESQSRFNAVFDKASTTFYQLENKNLVRGSFHFKLLPTTKNNEEVATIFTGLVALHDDAKYNNNDPALLQSGRLCHDLPSCISHKKIPGDGESEIIVRGGSDPSPLIANMDFPKKILRVRLTWQFFQREGPDGSRCEIDGSKPVTPDRIPFVHAVNERKVVLGECFGAGYSGQGGQIIEVNLKEK